MVVFDSPGDSLPDFYHNMRLILRETRVHLPGLMKAMALAVRKGWGYDEIEKHSMALRALEAEDGSVDRAVEDCRKILTAALGKTEIEEAREAIKARFDEVRLEPERPHIRVGITGELMTSIEPYFNMDIERWLAKKGAVVERSLYMSDLFTPMGRNPVSGRDDDEIGQTSVPYLCHEIGGHGQINVAAAVDFARNGFDAVLHFFPFTCLPEIIAKTVFVRIAEELDIPILSISIDEQTGQAGMQTRLEALIDLAWSKKKKKQATSERFRSSVQQAKDESGHCLKEAALDKQGKVLGAPYDFRAYIAVSYTHLRAHETRHDLVCRLLLEKKK